MKWRADSEMLEPRHFEIKLDPMVGYYLYVFEDGVCIRDHLQDSLEVAIDAAFEAYQVPRDLWRAVESTGIPPNGT